MSKNSQMTGVHAKSSRECQSPLYALLCSPNTSPDTAVSAVAGPSRESSFSLSGETLVHSVHSDAELRSSLTSLRQGTGRVRPRSLSPAASLPHRRPFYISSHTRMLSYEQWTTLQSVSLVAPRSELETLPLENPFSDPPSRQSSISSTQSHVTIPALG